MEKFEKENWEFLVVSEEGIIFYDPDTITFYPKGIARVWTMVSLTDKGREKEVERRKTRGDPIVNVGEVTVNRSLIEMNLFDMLIRLLQAINQDKDGNVLFTSTMKYSEGNPWEKINPNSPFEKLYLILSEKAINLLDSK